MSSQEVEMFFNLELGCNIRTVTIAKEVHYVADDLGQPLGIRNIRDKIRRLDDDERILSRKSTENKRGNPYHTLVTEPGLYSLILSCPKSRQHGTGPWKFRRWVTHEVLPQLRKRGEYRIRHLENEKIRLEDEVERLEDETHFIKHNRLYKVAASIPEVRSRANWFNFVKDRRPRYNQFLEWQNNVPFIRGGFVQEVRAILAQA